MTIKTAINVAARACVVKDEKLLLVTNDSGYWYLPGGHVDPGETLPECAKRETFEETGYGVKVGDMIYCFEFYDKKFDSHKMECCFYSTIEKEPDGGKWEDLGHDKSVTAQKFFSLAEIQKLGNVQPAFLKEGKWLKAVGFEKVYMGYEESK